MDICYAKFDGVDGECTDKAFEKWCTVNGFQHGLINMSSGDRSTGGGGSKGIADHSEVHLTTTFDAACTDLCSACLGGKTFGIVEMALCRQSGEKKQRMLTVKLHNTFITRFDYSAGAGGEINVNLSLNYSKIELEYNKLDSKGASTGSKAASWNRETDEAAV